MPTSTALLSFMIASVIFVAIPGPNLAHIIGHGIASGRRGAVLAAAGVEIGTLVHIAAATIGVSAVLARSPIAFDVVRYLGVAYLIHLGVAELRRRPAGGAAPAPTRRHPLTQGVLVNILNPKATLFFAAFLPQFMDPAASAAGQALILGTTLFVIALTVDLAYALTAASLGRRLITSGTHRISGRILGGIHLAMAAVVVLAGQRPTSG
jgi:threonine/homoserine/homoserine lactone efflux protein